MAKSIDHKLCKITTITQETKEAFKTLGLGIICQVSDLLYVIGDPDLLVVNGKHITFQKGVYLVELIECENY